MANRLTVLAALVAIVVAGCGGSSATSPTTGTPSSPPSAVPAANGAASPAASTAVATSRPTPASLPTAFPRPKNMTLDGTCEPDHTCLGLLKPGTYHTKVLIPGFSFAIAETGWENIGQAGGNLALLSTTDPGDAILVFWRPRPTKPDGSPVAGVKNTVADIGAWLEQNKDLTVSKGTNVTVGGLKGRRWEVGAAPTATARDSGCPTTACVTFMRGTDPSSHKTWEWDWSAATSERMQLYLLDGPTDITAIVVDSLDGTTWDTLTAAADRIIKTMVFDKP
jgi:hypothetical protein